MTYTQYGQRMDGSYYGESYHDSQTPFPQSYSRDWWYSHTDEYPEYTEQVTHRHYEGYYYSDEGNYGGDKETIPGLDVQRPQPSYSPSDIMPHQYTADYFPRAGNEYYSQYKRQ
jgi:hypothetical protein